MAQVERFFVGLAMADARNWQSKIRQATVFSTSTRVDARASLSPFGKKAYHANRQCQRMRLRDGSCHSANGCDRLRMRLKKLIS